jgi:diguanylate cyclase (GGDEF)-like protein/PAS domain S-box-containing protein
MLKLAYRSRKLSVFLARYLWNISIISLFSLLVIGATLSWVAYDEYQQTQDSEFRLLEAHARNADVQLQQALTAIQRLLQQIAQEPHPYGPWTAHGGALARHQHEVPDLAGLLLTDASGRITDTSQRTLIGRNVAQASFFQHFSHGAAAPGMFMSRPETLLPGVTSVIFSLPLVDARQHFAGIVALGIDYRFFPGVLQAINSDDSGSMSVIFNRNGDLLYRRSQPGQYFGKNISRISTVFQEHERAHLAVTRHIGPSAHDGKTRLFLVRDVGNTGIGLILSRQLSDVLWAWQRNVAIYALIFLFTIVVVVALTRVSARRKQSEAARLLALGRIEKITSQVPGLVFEYCLHADGHSSMPYASEAIRVIFRLQAADIRHHVGMLFKRVHPQDREAFGRSLRKAAHEQSHWHHEFRTQFSDGSIRWLLGNAIAQGEADGSVHLHGFITDITERKQMEDKIRQLAFYDPLTRLPNRRLLNDRLSQALSASLRNACYGAVMIIDLDNFKPLNDTHGHLVGDMLLVEAAERLKSCVRKVDTVARFGGDEFVLVLSELHRDREQSKLQAALVAEKVLASLSAPYALTLDSPQCQILNLQHYCTASIGVHLFIHHQDSQHDAIRLADHAMYQAKQAGRNQIQFHEPV